MLKGPDGPPKIEKKSVLDVLRNEPSVYTGVIKSAVVLVVGLGYLSQSTGDTVAVLLTAMVMLLLTVIDRQQSYGPVTHEEAVKNDPR